MSRSALSDKNIDQVNDDSRGAAPNSEHSPWNIMRETGILKSSVVRIIRKDLQLEHFLRRDKFWLLISQGSAATYLRCGGYRHVIFKTNFTAFLAIKECWQSVKFWPSYSKLNRVHFGTQCIMLKSAVKWHVFAFPISSMIIKSHGFSNQSGRPNTSEEGLNYQGINLLKKNLTKDSPMGATVLYTEVH